MPWTHSLSGCRGTVSVADEAFMFRGAPAHASLLELPGLQSQIVARWNVRRTPVSFLLHLVWRSLIRSIVYAW